MIFLEELAKRGIVNDEQISEIVKVANKRYGGDIYRALLEFNLDKNEILEIKGQVFNMPIKIFEPKSVLPSTLKLIPLETAKMYHFVPIGVNDEVIEIGIVDPENVQAVDVLTFITTKLNKPFKLFLINATAYDKIIEMYDGLSNEVDQALSDLDSEIAAASKEGNLITKKKKSDGEPEPEGEKITEDAPIIRIVAVILTHATEGNASDIHIEHVGDKVKVRFRVDGVLYTSLLLPVNVFNGVIARIKILAKLRLDEKRKPQDGGFSAKISGRKIDFRVSTLPAYYGEKIVIRILDPQKGVRALDSLNMSKEHSDLIREVLDRPYGLVLITGPTGSGKTTTLYAMVNELDHEKKNIVSLEDPVEYQISGINQSQVAPEIGYTFASGLRSILRQDPDIIMVGEIRDRETAELAIQAALTGHLVFSTLHTNSAVGAIPRLIDMGIDPYLIAPTLALCIAQRLSVKINPESKKVVPMDESVNLMLKKQFGDLPEAFRSKLNLGDKIHEAVPTPGCLLGTSGREAIYEMFKIDEEMQSLILKRPGEQEVFKLARSKGMLTMKEDAIIKSIKGEIPFREVYNF